jgi:hypothetical protein
VTEGHRISQRTEREHLFFEINFDSPKGEETSKPKLTYHDKEQSRYE